MLQHAGASHADFGSMMSSGWSGGSWRTDAQHRFYAIVREHHRAIVAMFFGHLHTGSVRLLRKPLTDGLALGPGRHPLNLQGVGGAGCEMPVAYLSPSLTSQDVQNRASEITKLKAAN